MAADDTMAHGPRPPAEVTAYYDRYPEEDRLARGVSRLELERTRELLTRFLPRAPAVVIDVGGAAGVYSSWLAERGYGVHLVDGSARLVAEARRRDAGSAHRIASFTVADARGVPHPDGCAQAVLVMGPLYHLADAADRVAALAEARRMLAPGGIVMAAAISRYASTLDGLARMLVRDPAFVAIRDRDLVDGQHRNVPGVEDYFTTAYFHLPEELERELHDAGFEGVRIFGVEGPGWLLGDFDARWADPAGREALVEAARLVEEAPAMRGVSAHFLAIASRVPPSSR